MLVVAFYFTYDLAGASTLSVNIVSTKTVVALPFQPSSLMSTRHWLAFKPNKQTLAAPAHLLPAVTIVPLQMPLDEGVRRARLALQEGAAPLHAVLHHLQGVFIGCRDEQADRQIKTNPFRTTTNSHHPQLSAAKTSALANHHPAFQLPARCRNTVITANATNGGEC